MAAEFGRKALLVLLYLIGRLAGRPSRDCGSRLDSGPVFGEAPASSGKVDRQATPLRDRDSSRTTTAAAPSKALFRALNSAVECHLHTVEVAGSNPAAPTTQRQRYKRAGHDYEQFRRHFLSRFGEPASDYASYAYDVSVRSSPLA